MDQLPTVDHGPATSNRGWGALPDGASDVHPHALLAAAASRGADERFGPAVLPRFRWDQPGTSHLARDLEAEGVPFEFALQALYTAAADRGTADGGPPKSLKYFAPIVLRMWREAQQQAVTDRVPTPARLAASPTDADVEADMLRRIAAGEFLPPELREVPT